MRDKLDPRVFKPPAEKRQAVQDQSKLARLSQGAGAKSRMDRQSVVVAAAAASNAVPLGRSKGAAAGGKRKQPAPNEPPPDEAPASNATETPKVTIEVELHDPMHPTKAVQPRSIIDMMPDTQMPFEAALERIVSAPGPSNVPLRKMFYFVYRERVKQPSAVGGETFRIKWAAEARRAPSSCHART